MILIIILLLGVHDYILQIILPYVQILLGSIITNTAKVNKEQIFPNILQIILEPYINCSALEPNSSIKLYNMIPDTLKLQNMER